MRALRIEGGGGVRLGLVAEALPEERGDARGTPGMASSKVSRNASVGRVSHDATLAGHVHRVPSLAAPDRVSVSVGPEERGLQVLPHQALVKSLLYAGQLSPKRAAVPRVERIDLVHIRS